MSRRGRAIYDLEGKLRVAAEVCCDHLKIEGPHVAELARKAQIPQGTLATASKNGTMSVALERKFSAFLGFSPQHPAWFDPRVRIQHAPRHPEANYNGRDTKEAFRQLLHECLSRDLATTFVGEAISADHQLLRLTFDDAGQATPYGSDHELFFSLLFEVGRPHNDVKFGFRKVRIRLLFGNQSGASLNNIAAAAGSIILRDAELRAEGRGSATSWYLTASNRGALEGEYATADAALCAISDLAVGEFLEAEVSVQTRDPDALFVKAKSNVKAETEAIISALLANSIDEKRDTWGWKTLGIHRLRVVHYEP